jgi:hypothetical protein
VQYFLSCVRNKKHFPYLHHEQGFFVECCTRKSQLSQKIFPGSGKALPGRAVFVQETAASYTARREKPSVQNKDMGASSPDEGLTDPPVPLRDGGMGPSSITCPNHLLENVFLRARRWKSASQFLQLSRHLLKGKLVNIACRLMPQHASHRASVIGEEKGLTEWFADALFTTPMFIRSLHSI